MASNVGNIKVKLNLDSAAYDKGIKKAVGSITNLSAALGALGIGATVAQIGRFVNALKEQQQAERAVESVIRSTGNAAGVTTKEIARMASEFQSLSNYGDEAIMSGQKLLLTFTNIKGDTFRAATKAMLDMSAVMGQDLTQTATMLGKALQDPIKGVTALRRVGVMLSESQKEQIKNFMAVGDVAKAQAVILKEVETEFGNAAQNLIEPTEQFKNKLGDVEEELGTFFKPAVDAAANAGIHFGDVMIDTIHKVSEWVSVNNTIVGGLRDAAVALSALAIGIPVTNAAVVTIITSMRNFGTVTAQTTAYQVAFATFLRGESALAMLQFRAAVQATIIQVRALTISLLQCPLTWVTLVLGAGVAAWWAYQQQVKRTQRVIEDLNNAQTEQVNKTSDAIRTLKELQGAKQLDYNQTKRLDAAISYLTEKYPKYIGRLREELRLKGQISRATAEQIANEMMLSKVKGLQEERVKLNKDMMRDMKISSLLGKAKGGGRYGITKANQKRDDALNAEKKKLEAERQGIINELTALEKDSQKASQYVYSVEKAKKSGSKSSKKSSSSNGAEKRVIQEEKQRQKELLDIKIAKLEREKYLTEKSEEEIHKIELKQIEERLNAAQVGTSEYEEILNQKLKLEQDYAKNARAAQQAELVERIEFEKQMLESNLSNIEIGYSAYQMSRKEQLSEEIKLIQQKIALEQRALQEQLQVMANNETEKVKLRRESTKEQIKLTQELTRKNVELKSYEFEKVKGFIEETESSITSSFSSVIRGEMTLADAANRVLDQMVDNFINQVANMAWEWVNQHLYMIVHNNAFAASTTATNAQIVASNSTVAASNTVTAGSSSVLTAANTVLSTSNTAVAASASAAATTTATSAGVMSAAASGMAAGITTILSPIATLAATMGTLALTSSAVAANMAIIALTTGLYTIESVIANVTTNLLNTSFAALAITSKLAAKGVASLAIANAANSAAAIPFVGWVIAPGAAAATGTAIMASSAAVTFMEKGGPVEAGKPYIVGEKRPELFIPDRSGRIIPDISNLGGGGDTVNNYSLSSPITVIATDAKSFESRLGEYTNVIHKNLMKKIRSRQLGALA